MNNLRPARVRFATLFRKAIWLPAIVAAGVVAGCVGDIGDTSSPIDGPGGPPSSPEACASAPISPGTAPSRRMTRFEYDNTVRDLLGDATNPALQFPADEVSGVFNNQASALVVTELLAEGYMAAAEQLATNAVVDLQGLTGCDTAAKSEKECGAAFVASFGARAFRRPLDADAKAMLTGVFDQALATWDYPTAIRLVIEAALESPRFLYRIEFGMPDPTSDGVVQLDAYEMASRLSYLLWGSMPDEALLGAAAANKLSTPDELAAQAKRMLDDPRARDVVANFHEQWLNLAKLDTADRDASIYPSYDPAYKAMWADETRAFVNDVVFDGGGDVGTLLTAPYTMMNAEIAAFYGVAPPSGEGFHRVQLDPKQRAGILTQPSVLAVTAHEDQTSPVLRGRFVRERLLCQNVPPPPPNVNAVPPTVDSGATTRERFSQHETDPYCASCHHLMDPIGFGFEHFDALGQWRAKDQGLPIDDSGDVVDSEDADGTFHGAVELAARLSESAEVRACVVKQWFRYGQGRQETQTDACTIASLETTFAAAKYDVKSLLVALTQTDAFRYRTPVVAGK